MGIISYHGTSKKHASKIIGPPSSVDVSVGKGELGQGFYTGSSIALAAIWAQSRYHSQAVVIKFDIPEDKFVQLKGKKIPTQAKVNELWDSLKESMQTATHKLGFDYTVAPFAKIEEMGCQYKFESEKAEKQLNDCVKTEYACES